MGLFDSIEKGLGEAIDGATDFVGDKLEDLGFDGAGRAVKDLGDAAANAMGAMPDEKELGETDDPKELVLGDPSAIRSRAEKITAFGKNFSDAEVGLKAMSAGHWTGEGAQAYEQATATEWPKWGTASDAATSAAAALSTWAADVEFAQRKASEAITLWKEAERKGAEWRADVQRKTDAYNKQVDDYNNGDSMVVPVRPNFGTNPEPGLKEEAKRTLKVGRDHRNDAASGIKSSLDGAANMAPPMPSTVDQIKGGAEDLYEGGNMAVNHFGSGLITAVTATAKVIRTVDPTNPYNVANPGAYVQNVARMGAGVTHQIAHPAEAVRGFIGGGWSSDPAAAAGALTANLGMTVMPGPKGLSGLTTAGRIAKVADKLPGVTSAKGLLSTSSKIGGAGERSLGAAERGAGVAEHGAGAAEHGGASPSRASATEGGAPSTPVAAKHDSPAAPASSTPEAGPNHQQVRAESPGGADSSDSHGPADGAGPGGKAEPSGGPGPGNGPGPGSGPETGGSTHDAGPHDGAPGGSSSPEPLSNRTDPVSNDHAGPDAAGSDHAGSGSDHAGSDHAGRPDAAGPDPAGPDPARPDRLDTSDDVAPPEKVETPTAAGDHAPGDHHESPDTSPARSEDGPSPTRPDDGSSVPQRSEDGSSVPPRSEDGPSPSGSHDPPRTAPTSTTVEQLPTAKSPDAPVPGPHRVDEVSPTRQVDPVASSSPTTSSPAPVHSGTPSAGHSGTSSSNPSSAGPSSAGPSNSGPSNPAASPQSSSLMHRPADASLPSHRPDGPLSSKAPENVASKVGGDGDGPRRVENAQQPIARKPGDELAPVLNNAEARAGAGGGTGSPGGSAGSGGSHGGGPGSHNGGNGGGEHNYSPNGETGSPNLPGDTGHTNDGAADQASKPNGNEEPHQCTRDGEPVNVATGEYFLPMTDVELPGVLPLRLTHQHRSRYRWGMWFGPTAVGTLDARVIVDDDGVTSVDADGTMLRFPHPQPDSPVRPAQGWDWELSLTGTGGYRLRQLKAELSYYFEPKPQLGGADVEGGAIMISAIMDRHLNRILFSYDGNGWPVAVEHSAGYRIEVSTDGARILGYRLVAGIDGAPVDEQLRTFNYHDGHLAEVRNGVGASTYFQHDDEGRMVSWIDSLGQEYWNRYDGLGRVVRQSGVDGVWAGTFKYRQFADGAGSLTMYIDAGGGVTTYGIDQDGRVRRHIDAMGRESATDYNGSREPLRRADPLGATTVYRYTDDGDLAEITDPLGARTRIDYVAAHQPSVVVAADGGRTSYTYDEHGNVASIIDSFGATTQFTYDETGGVRSVEDADGVVTRYDLNGAGQPVRIIDGFGNATEIGYDGFGRVVSVVDAEGNVSSVTYDAEGRRTSETDAAGATQQWTYDGEGNCLAYVDALGAVTRWEYGYFDLPVARIDADGSRTTFTYDTTRRLTAVTNAAGLEWTYVYNLDGTLAVETDFNGATTTYTYDGAGRLASRRNAAGQVVSFTYDACGRVVRESSSGDDPSTFGGENVDYEFDPVGRLISSAGVFGAWSAQYSLVGRPTAFTLGDSRIDVEWTPAGQLAGVVAPSGMRTDYAYDARGVLEGVTAAGRVCQLSTDRVGRETRRRFGGAAVDSVWDQVGRLVGRSVIANPVDPSALSLGGLGGSSSPEATVESSAFSYRADGALVGSSGPAGASEYGLDVMGRVVQRSQGDRREAYRFDAAGNMAAAGGGHSEAVGGWEFSGTLLTEDGRSSYRYDAAGRLVSVVTKRLSRRADVWRYRWDAWDRLREITVPDGTVFAYSYDHAGRRVAKANTSSGVVTRFWWLGELMVEQSVMSAAGGVSETTSWAYAPGALVPLAQVHASGGSTVDVALVDSGPVSVVDTGVLNLGGPPSVSSGAGGRLADQSWVDREFFAIVADQVSSPVALVEASSGEVVGRAVSSVWGLTAWSGEVSTPWRMPGQYFDAESGLHYNRFRYYQPGTGRYVSPDPLGLSPAPNPYSYPGNPTVVCDPLGLAPAKACEALKNWENKRYTLGNVQLLLARSDVWHMLSRHHPDYWDGTVKDTQTFFDSKMKIEDVKKIVAAVLNQNRSEVIRNGPIDALQIEGKYGGKVYTVGFMKGHIRQLYPSE